MSKQLDGILGRATRATAPEVLPPKIVRPEIREPEVPLQAMVPASIVDAVRLLAAQKGAGWTQRRVLLEALKSYGVPVPEDALRDRRR